MKDDVIVFVLDKTAEHPKEINLTELADKMLEEKIPDEASPSIGHMTAKYDEITLLEFLTAIKEASK